jgi:exodeoxyribonuclease-3
MKIVSWNVNGLRAASKKGFLDWLKNEDADIVCLQEVKAREEQLAEALLRPEGYCCFFNPAVKRGYSGVMVYSREKPKRVEKSLGHERFDSEGRILELTYPGFTLINLYLPHGGRDKSKLDYKLAVYDKLLRKLKRKSKEKLILIGDFNIAHTKIDLARPKGNLKNIMFTPEEREMLDRIIDCGYIDSFRVFNQEGGHYSWWPYGLNARPRNIGWRIDYCFVSKPLTKKLRDGFILPQVTGSDHCPIGIKIA